jgi:hypothetical protein
LNYLQLMPSACAGQAGVVSAERKMLEGKVMKPDHIMTLGALLQLSALFKSNFSGGNQAEMVQIEP